MKFAMHRLQSLLIDMRVHLRRRNIRVPEHLLDDAQIGPVPEQMRGKTVPQQMRINICLQTGMTRPHLHDLPHARRR